MRPHRHSITAETCMVSLRTYPLPWKQPPPKEVKVEEIMAERGVSEEDAIKIVIAKQQEDYLSRRQ